MMKNYFYLLLSICLLLPALGRAQSDCEIENFKNITQDVSGINKSSDPHAFINVNGTIYFGANVSELWKSDGTVEGTQLVKKTNENEQQKTSESEAYGSNDQFIASLVNIDNTIYFTQLLVFGNSFRALWKSDGTPEGTTIVPGLITDFGTNSQPKDLVVLGDQLYFTAKDSEHGRELWTLDETGTAVLAMDINPTGNSNPIGFTLAGDELYFTADDGTHGREPWKIDADGNITLVADLNSGTSGSSPRNFTAFANQIFFSSGDLFRIDETGTITPTTDIEGRSRGTIRDLTIFGDYLYFSAYDRDNGFELWKSDAGGNITLVKDINPNADSRPQNLTVAGNHLYFSADDGTNGYELWKMDELDNVTLAMDINPTTPVTSQFGNSFPVQLTAVGDQLYFSANDGTNGIELWKVATDGSVTMAMDINPTGDSNPTELIAVGDELLFKATDGLNGRELWKVDAAGAVTLAKNINTTNISSGISLLTKLGNQLYFRSNAGTTGTELWTIDENKNVSLAKDISPDGDGSPHNLVPIGDQLFFIASAERNMPRLWKLDVDGNAVQLEDGSSNGASVIRNLTPIGNQIYFTASDENSDKELWKMDADENFSRVADIHPTGSSSPRRLVALDNQLFFSAREENDGYELYKMDEQENVTKVADIRPDGGSNPDNLTAVGEELYFTANDGTSTELWKIGATGDAIKIKDNSPAIGSFPGNLTVVGEQLFFTSSTNDNGQELWKIDAAGNAVLVQDINPTGSSSPTKLTAVGDQLFFRANDGTNGTELWRVDALGNTAIVKDINPTGNSRPDDFIAVGNQLFFTADDEVSFGQLWVSDGTSAGTVQVVNNISSSNSIFNMIDYNGQLLFTADTPESCGMLLTVGCATCPADLTTTTAPAATVTTESTCDIPGSTPSGGLFSAPTTDCPTGSKLQYSTDDGENWSLTLPNYDQENAVTLLTRCNCNLDSDISSETASITSKPGTCPAPFILNLSGNTTYAEETDNNTTATFTITRSGNTTNAVSCSFGLRAYGVNSITADDFVEDPFILQTVNFAAGVTEQQVSVMILGDALVEKTETFYAIIQDISTGNNYANNYLICTISDDDDTPVGIAGADILDACETTVSLGLHTDLEESGEGMWTIVAGAGGSFSDFNDYQSDFTGSMGLTYILRWTSGSMSDEMCISFAGDSDEDGVSDCEDQCPFFDDNIDSDMDGAPDACDCNPNSADDAEIVLPDGTMMGGVIPTGMYDSSGTIESTGTVAEDSDVTYKAAVSITLNAGFKIEAGALFHAYIAPCTYNPDYQVPAFDENGVTERQAQQVTSTEQVANALAITAYPNPAKDFMQIGFDLATDTPVTMDIINAMGKRVAIPLQNNHKAAGKHLHGLNLSHLQTGIYYVRVQTETEQAVQRIVVQ